MKTIVKAAVLAAGLAFVGAAHATSCTAKFTDCNGVEQTTNWNCQSCWPPGTPNLGTCSPVVTRQDPNDPKSCIQSVSPGCSACVYPV